MADFLLEIGLEEIPARMIAGAEAELGRRVNDLLARERLLGPLAKLTTYSTPRRLAVLAEDVLASQADTEEQLTGPSWKVAFKDGAPTAAAEAFAKKACVAVSALEKVTNAKGEYVGATVKRLGRAAADLLTSELPKEVLSLYWAKNMYWRAGKPERFVRPVRWVVALLDSAVVPLEIAGIAAGNASRGHRILHGEEPVMIDTAKNYSEKLRAARVVADVAERRHIIRKALDAATRTIPGARWREDELLIETVVHLTEWPSVVLGGFEREYLALPEEVLVTVMRDHQKYFAVEDANGKLAPHFLAVLNTLVDAEGLADRVGVLYRLLDRRREGTGRIAGGPRLRELARHVNVCRCNRLQDWHKFSSDFLDGPDRVSPAPPGLGGGQSVCEERVAHARRLVHPDDHHPGRLDDGNSEEYPVCIDRSDTIVLGDDDRVLILDGAGHVPHRRRCRIAPLQGAFDVLRLGADEDVDKAIQYLR